MATISFDLVSPENLIFNDEVGMIIVPGKDGDFGVLPGHSKVMSSLRPGRVMVYGEGKSKEIVAIMLLQPLISLLFQLLHPYRRPYKRLLLACDHIHL